MVGSGALFNFYKTNIDLIRCKTFSVSELESMLPYERSVYIDLYNAAVEKEKSK